MDLLLSEWPRAARRWRAGLVAAVSLLTLLAGPARAGRDRLDLHAASVDLPGPPAAILPADVDGDGWRDLVVVVAYTEWQQISVEEEVAMDDVEGLVEMLTIVPSLFDRRQLFVFRGSPSGLRQAGAALELDLSVLAIEGGPPGLPVVALTDDGLSALSLDESGQPRLRPFLEAPPVLSGSGALLPTLDILQDVDGDGLVDLLLPASETTDLYWAEDLLAAAAHAGFEAVASPPRARLHLPEQGSRGLRRRYPLPAVDDVDGDGRPDLIVRPRGSWNRFSVLRNEGGGRFSRPEAPLGEWQEMESRRDSPSAVGDRREVIYFGDIDGDGVAEYMTAEDLSDEDAGFRKEMKQAKRPPMRTRVHASTASFALDPVATQVFESVGYATVGDEDADEVMRIPGGLQDLDGDGRLDLITVTLDFSLLQAFRVLATRSVSLGIDFHIYCQGEDGSFHHVDGLDLSGKFKLRLDDLRLGQLSQFAGDFNGDGRADFLQMGRGKKVTLHQGLDGCRYNPRPDFVIDLKEEPRNLALVKVGDYDGDALSDLLVIQPREAKEATVTPPVRLDLYLSGSGQEEGASESAGGGP